MKIKNKNTIDKVFIIAEIGNNHEGSFSNAKKLIDKAIESGADAVKFQTFIVDQLISTHDQKRVNQLKKFELNENQFLKLKNYANKKKIIFLSTPFDLKSAKFLNQIVPAFKISSGDNNFYPLITYLAQTKKPLLLSTGIASISDIKKTVTLIRKNNKEKSLHESIALLHCVSSYPTPFEFADLNRIKKLAKLKCTVGYSDHTVGLEACLLAVSYGARIIEKHFTLDNNFSSFRDHKISLNPIDFKNLVSSIRNIETMIQHKKSIKLNYTTLRRSIIINTDLNKGSKVSLDHISWVRPGNGLMPGQENKIIGKKLNKFIKKGTQIKISDIVK